MPIMDRFPELTAVELSRLVTAASQVLVEQGIGDESIPPDLLDMAPRSIAGLIADELRPNDASTERVKDVVEDPASAQQLAIKVIGLVRSNEELTALIEQRYDELERKMFAPELMLLIGALVVLAMRVKRVRIGQSEVTFYPASDEVKAFVVELAAGIAK